MSWLIFVSIQMPEAHATAWRTLKVNTNIYYIFFLLNYAIMSKRIECIIIPGISEVYFSLPLKHIGNHSHKVIMKLSAL